MKKIISIITFWVVLLGLVICSNAATPGDNEIITNSNPGHTFTAYQIFIGDLSTDKTILTNIVWGIGVNSANLLAKLKENTLFTNCETAEDVADVLATSGDVNDFAKTVSTYVNTVNGVISVKEGNDYKITVSEPGYYLIVDSLTDNLENAYSKYIV